MNKTFNYDKARSEGYSEEEIGQFLRKQNPKFNYDEAKKSGYSDSEINQFLLKSPLPQEEGQQNPAKLQEPFTFKGAGKAYATGYGGGIGGTPGDIASLASNFGNIGFEEGEIVPSKQSINSPIPGTHETTEMFGGDARNAAERILTHAGEWGGQGTLWAGLPGTVAGSILGTLYGSFMELTDSPVWATGLTLLASIGHPEIASNLWKKSGSKGVAFEEALAKSGLPEEEINKVKNTVTDVNASGKPPPPPGGGTPPPPQQDFGRVLIDDIRNAFQKPHKAIEEEILPGVNEISKSPFNIAEEALEATRPNTKGQPLGIEVPVSNQGKPLQGRVSTTEAPQFNPTIETKPLGIDVPISSNSPKSLKGRVTTEPKLGESVSKESFTTDASAGREISSAIKNNFNEEKKVYTKLYADADPYLQTKYASFPKVEDTVSKMIDQLENIPKRNASEEAVYKQATTIRELVGTKNGLLNANAKQLKDQANSMSKLADYELPYPGYKSQIKKLVKAIDEEVLEKFAKTPKRQQLIRDADKEYAKYADKFFSDEVRPFLEKTIHDPEELFRKSIRDKGTYRAVKNALGPEHPLIQRIDRALVEETMGKYFQKPNLVGSEKYHSDLANLEELIGVKKTANVNHRLQKKYDSYQKERSHKEKIARAEEARTSKPETKTALDRIKERSKKYKNTTNKDLFEKLDTPQGRQELKSELSKTDYDNLVKLKEHSQKKSPAQREIERRGEEMGKKLNVEKEKPKTELDKLAERIAKHQGTKPEDLLQKLNSRSGIRELRKEYPKNIFDQMTKSKMREILREGNIEKNYKGKDLYNVLNKRSNNELFSEIIGEAETEAAQKLAKQFGEDVVTVEKAAKLGASLTGLTFLRKLAHVI